MCFEKDMAYAVEFYKDGLPYYLSVDFTTPLSWIKGTSCHIEGEGKKKCNRIEETVVEKVKKSVKKSFRYHKTDDD